MRSPHLKPATFTWVQTNATCVQGAGAGAPLTVHVPPPGTVSPGGSQPRLLTPTQLLRDAKAAATRSTSQVGLLAPMSVPYLCETARTWHGRQPPPCGVQHV